MIVLAQPCGAAPRVVIDLRWTPLAISALPGTVGGRMAHCSPGEPPGEGRNAGTRPLLERAVRGLLSEAPIDSPLGASFRDPSGFVFERDGALFRRIHRRYASEYDQLMSSGLYTELVERELLIPHEEVTPPSLDGGEPYTTVRPERVAFVSYPYEWCFSQLKDAALTTLRVQRTALRFGMTLKDASAYNVQFHRGRPILIDTLSFTTYTEGAPWVAYRQFCQHFLAPLALMAYRDVRLGQLLKVHLDGIPLDLARSLLPARAWLSLQLLLHIRVHARYQTRYAGDTTATRRVRPLSSQALDNLLEALASAVTALDWQPEGTEWADYYSGDSYSVEASNHKLELVTRHLERIAPSSVWDLGANTGVMSRRASARGVPTLALDIDPACVERNYRTVRAEREENLLPLLLDLANPSPARGGAHAERASLVERSGADAVLALALIHHLAISNNVPLEQISSLFARLAPWLVIEWVPKQDPKVQQLLATREDIFDGYTQAGFEAAFERRFETLERTAIHGSERTLYLLQRREGAAASAWA